MNNRISLTLVFSLLAVLTINAQLRESQRFSDWGPVVHLPPPINSEFDDHAAILSPDELTMYFTSNRTGSVDGSEDIWMSTRKSIDSPWGEPVNLGTIVNTPAMERVRAFADGGRVLLYQSDRGDGFGQSDIWAIARDDVDDDRGWGKPVNMGPMINTAFTELAASYLFADSGRVNKFFFSSNKVGGVGGPDIYESTISALGFEFPANVFELNSPSIETCFRVRDDGLELIFTSNRPSLSGDRSQDDLWVATRDTVYDSWSAPVRLGPNINVPAYQDVNPSLSFDNQTMFMASRRPGGIGDGTYDIYVTTRSSIGQ